MTETTVSNLPVAAIWIIAIFQLLLALALVAVLALFGGQIGAMLKDVREMVQDLKRETVPPILRTLRQVKTTSDEAARSVHQVATKADQATTTINTVVARTQGPAVKVAGFLGGVLIGARALGMTDDKKKKR